MDVANKQLTIDFVNQSIAQQAGQIETPEVGQTERAEFAEKLGDVNRRYNKLSGLVQERVTSLELSEHRWETYDEGVNSMTNWVLEQTARMQKLRQIGNEMAVQQAIKECKVSFAINDD